MSYFVYPKGDLEVCKICEGNGKILIWRSDLEDFDEIACPECNKNKN